MVFVAGRKSIAGAILGAVVIEYLTTSTSFISTNIGIIEGIALLVILIAEPDGVAGAVDRLLGRRTDQWGSALQSWSTAQLKTRGIGSRGRWGRCTETPPEVPDGRAEPAVPCSRALTSPRATAASARSTRCPLRCRRRGSSACAASTGPASRPCSTCWPAPSGPTRAASGSRARTPPGGPPCGGPAPGWRGPGRRSASRTAGPPSTTWPPPACATPASGCSARCGGPRRRPPGNAPGRHLSGSASAISAREPSTGSPWRISG